ncbi:N-acetylglucosamine-1-phosphotransferase subunit gamma-like isoform X2 [Tachypleus tridentatus]|uniref:N-acetylglucosamine-1-phosphotransferase subunit gamma-like isoform X2 n=1 Tax=Tachypleus tridentatus TaxID=6853 RepID=UPI003FD67A04
MDPQEMYFLWTYLFVVILCEGTKVSIKIIQEPASLGYNGNSLVPDNNNHNMVPRTRPANFSGPVQFKQLVGKCFNMTGGEYLYTFCPFQNMTQVETLSYWNSYQGIIGVWTEWRIENNSFVAMLMTKGSRCGDKDRSVEVTFMCAPNNSLLNVTEPKKCEYQATFGTLLVCHRDAMLVYPRLSADLRAEWDKAETELKYNEITEKGYKAQLDRIFTKAGFQTSHHLNKSRDPSSDNKYPDGGFQHFDQCKQELEEVKQERDELKKEIENMKVLLGLKITSSKQKGMDDEDIKFRPIIVL